MANMITTVGLLTVYTIANNTDSGVGGESCGGCAFDDNEHFIGVVDKKVVLHICILNAQQHVTVAPLTQSRFTDSNCITPHYRCSPRGKNIQDYPSLTQKMYQFHV